MPGPSGMPSAMSSSACSCGLDASFDEGPVSCRVEIVLGVIGAVNFCDSPESGPLDAGAFLRDLNENFLGGLKALRVACSFSESALMVYPRHFIVMYKSTCEYT